MMLDHHEGQWAEVNPLLSGVVVPDDSHKRDGRVLCYPYVSFESFWGSIPTDFGDVPPVEMWFSTLPPEPNAVLRDQALRLLEQRTDPETAIGTLFDGIDLDLQRWLTVPDDYTPIPTMWLRAVGYKQGRLAYHDCWLPASASKLGGGFLTSSALTAAALKILRGDVTERGIMTAEHAFDPQSFFKEIAQLLPEPPPHGQLVGESLHWLD